MIEKSEDKKQRKRPTIKRSGVQAKTIDNVARKVVAAQAANVLEFEQRQVPLSKIHIWDSQPRTLHLTIEDVCRGNILDDDEHALIKNDELLQINTLALSIAKQGLINSPIAYALPGKDVQLIGGERRTLASIYALFHIVPSGEAGVEYETIHNESPDRSLLETERMLLKVFPKKPDEIELECLAMTDNANREDLSIPDRLRWAIRFDDKKQKRNHQIEHRELIATLGLSRSRAFAWLKVLNERSDKWVSLVIEKVCNNKANFKKLEQLAEANPEDRESLYKAWFESPAQDSKTKIPLGVSTNLDAIRSLVLKNIPEEHREHFEKINWKKAKNAKNGFAEFLNIWEKQHD